MTPPHPLIPDIKLGPVYHKNQNFIRGNHERSLGTVVVRLAGDCFPTRRRYGDEKEARRWREQAECMCYVGASLPWHRGIKQATSIPNTFRTLELYIECSKVMHILT